MKIDESASRRRADVPEDGKKRTKEIQNGKQDCKAGARTVQNGGCQRGWRKPSAGLQR